LKRDCLTDKFSTIASITKSVFSTASKGLIEELIFSNTPSINEVAPALSSPYFFFAIRDREEVMIFFPFSIAFSLVST
jgi:hypothetical protein